MGNPLLARYLGLTGVKAAIRAAGDGQGEPACGSLARQTAGAGSAAPTCHQDKSHRFGLVPGLDPLDLVPDRMKRPQVPPRWSAFTYADNGRFARVKLRDVRHRGPGGQRGQITGFTTKSRRALLELVNSIDQAKCRPGQFAFVTLTYPRAFPTASASKRDLDTLIKRFEREYGPRWLIWKLEPQLRGAPHYHLLVDMGGSFNADQLCTWWAQAWHDLAGGGDRHHLRWHLGQLGNRPCVEQVRDWQGVANYAGKYLGKISEGGEEWQHPGRFWGQRRHNLSPITRVSEFLPDTAANILRRHCIRYFQKQQTGWLYVPGKALSNGMHRPGHRYHKRSPVVADLQLLDVQPRWQRRRWRRSRGTWSGFIPAATFKRLVEWSIVQALGGQ